MVARYLTGGSPAATSVPQSRMSAVPSPFELLTRREAEVLAEIMNGRSAEDISRDSWVAISTVRSQIKAILQKLGVGSQIAAVALARRSDWSFDGPEADHVPEPIISIGTDDRTCDRPHARSQRNYSVVKPLNIDTKRVLLIDAETRPRTDVNCPKWILQAAHTRGIRVKAITVKSNTPNPKVACDADDVALLLLDRGAGVQVARSPEGPWERWERLTAHLASKGAQVVVVAAQATLAAIAACLKAGAKGFIAVNEAEALLDAIVGAGSDFDPARIDRPALMGRPAVEKQQLERLARLTTAEFRVLFYMVKGYPASRIAARLDVPVATAEGLIRSIMRALGVESELAAVALANGFAGVDV